MPGTPDGPLRMRHLKAGIIFLLTLLAFAGYTPQDVYNPQQVTRLALTLAMTEGRLDIDDYAALTVDLAEHEGHFYADKPPGLSLLAVPGVALARQFLGVPTGVLDREQFPIAMIVAVLSTVGLLAALATAALYLLCRRLGLSDAAALFAAAALALGTPFFGWSTAFFAHAATGSLLLLALALAVRSRRRVSGWVAPLLGLLLGYTLTTDLVSAPAVAVIALYFLLAERERRWSRLVGGSVGGVAGLLPLLIYNQMVFGSPFTLGYSQVVGFEGMKQGLFGLTVPNPAVIGEVLFGLHRGLLPLAPVLLLLPLGWWRMAMRPDMRALGAATLGVALSFLLVNASYFYWDGGSSTGPRHLIGMLPVLGLVLAFGWPRGRRGQVAALGLLGASVLISAACASTYMFADVRFPAPFFYPILTGLISEGVWVRMLNVLVPCAGFLLLLKLREPPSGPEGDELAARPFDAPIEIELEQQRLDPAGRNAG